MYCIDGCSAKLKFMMTSSNGNIFRVTGPLCGEFTGPGEFPTQRPVTRSFYVLICVWINGWVNNREAGDLRPHRGHYDVDVMCTCISTKTTDLACIYSQPSVIHILLQFQFSSFLHYRDFVSILNRHGEFLRHGDYVIKLKNRWICWWIEFYFKSNQRQFKHRKPGRNDIININKCRFNTKPCLKINYKGPSK